MTREEQIKNKQIYTPMMLLITPNIVMMEVGQTQTI